MERTGHRGCRRALPSGMLRLLLVISVALLPFSLASGREPNKPTASQLLNPTRFEEYNERAVAIATAVRLLAGTTPASLLVTVGSQDAVETRKDASQARIGSLRAASLAGQADVLAALGPAYAGFFAPAILVEEPPTPETLSPKADKDQLVGIEDRSPLRDLEDNKFEYHSYCYLISLAKKVPQKQLTDLARTDVTYRQMLQEPHLYRGEIVHVTGRLTRITRLDALRRLKAEGIPTIYECWVFPEIYGPRVHPPLCLIVTELPPDVQVGEKVDYYIAFTGYFFKVYRYKAIDGVYDAPLLIGKTVSVVPGETTASHERVDWFDPMIFVWVLGTAVAILSVAFFMNWYYRRNNLAVRQRLLEAKRRATDADREIVLPEFQFRASDEAVNGAEK